MPFLEDWVIPIYGGIAALGASLIAAFSGGGLSLLLMPVLLLLTSHPYVSLLTISKTSATLMTLISSRIHLSKGRLDWIFLSWIGSAQIVGTAFGTYLVQYRFNQSLFTQMLGWTVLLTSVYLFFAKRIGSGEHEQRAISPAIYVSGMVFCALVSVLNGLFGGTGIFITIYFVVALRLTFIQAMAYSMPTFAMANVVQTSYLLLTEWVEWRLMLTVVIGSVIGSWWGTRLQYLKGDLWVRRAAIAVMFAIGCKVLWG